uniref:Uncharacterized protein n=1 Tax=Vespula pensylvanica TaxID=30213 RepID=A0A834U7M4_VESPE|nr:hypothetical protein H0235_010378 [Vespula pensylvanica]
MLNGLPTVRLRFISDHKVVVWLQPIPKSSRLMSGMKREQTFTSLCLERLSALVIVIEDPRRRESPSASYEHYTGEFV